MKIVVYLNNGTEAKTLTEKQVELLRRAVMAFIDERNEALVEEHNYTDAKIPPECVDLNIHFRNIIEIDDDLNILEAIRDLLYPTEVYEKAKEA